MCNRRVLGGLGVSNATDGAGAGPAAGDSPVAVATARAPGYGLR